ncbi:MAG TPA: CoA ester lyase [Vineibacter sp.]|nr:CoA ester lyase [Vineibacter sp.]
MQLPVTYLFAPGNRPERFDKAVAAQPDAIILDLEDSVHPASKSMARAAVAAWHEANAGSDCRRYIRLNGNTPASLAEDLEWLTGLRHPERCSGIFLPKAESIDAIMVAASRLAGWNIDARIIAIIETAKGLRAVDRIASVQAVARLAFGSLDFSLDIGCHQSNEAFLMARSRVVIASRAADLPPPIDGVSPALNDMRAVADDVAHARTLGFAAKLCIHPAQVPVVRDGFRPTDEQVEWARRVLGAVASGSYAAQVDGGMVDLPLIEQARRILHQVEPWDADARRPMGGVLSVAG